MSLKLASGIVLLAVWGVATAESSASDGFIEGSSLNILFRNTYWNRDYNRGVYDRNTWAQGIIGSFDSGFTQGTVGVGVSAFGLLGIRLDGGQPDMFPGERKHWADDTSQAGMAVKLQYANTVVKIGDQMPILPVLTYGDSRLLPQSYSGFLLTSHDVKGLELNVGRFTSESSMQSGARDSAKLKSISLVGGTYQVNDDVSGALYYSDVEDIFSKAYLNLNYTYVVSASDSVNFDFNAYKTRYHDDLVADRFFAQGILGRDNTIWSLAAKYSTGGHAVSLSYQESSGDVGYAYDLGDGGGTIWLANGYYADFSQKDEKSIQLYHEWDFAALGLPGLSWRIAYIKGIDIDTGEETGAKEREFFNQVKYTVQAGAAKGLTLTARNSIYRNNRSNSGYSVGLNEWRLFAEYPVNIF
ncbi:Porin D precursor [compost metagenome]